MAQANPFDQFDGQVAPVPVRQLQPIVGNVSPAEQERKAREEDRDETRLGVTLQGEERAAREETFKRIDTYRKEFLTDPTVRQFKEVEAAARQIVGLATRTDNDETPGPGDIGLIFSFMKALDPGSVVREGEFATAQNAGGIPETVRNYYNRVVEGGRLSPQLRREFANTAIQLYNTRRDVYDQFAETYRGRVADFGGDPDKEGIRLSSELTLPPPPQGELSGTGNFLTDEDRQLQARITEAYNRGANIGELQSIAAEYGRSFPVSTQEELDKGRAEGRAVTVSPSGVRSAASEFIGGIADSPVGAATIGAANALMMGGLDELAPILGADQATVQAAKEMLRERYPVSSFAGEVAGTVGQLAVGGAGVRALGGGARALGLTEVAQGAAYGAGESNDNRLMGAGIGAGGAIIGQQIAQRLLEPAAQQVVQRIAGETGAPPEAVQQVIAEAMEGAQVPAGAVADVAPVVTPEAQAAFGAIAREATGRGRKAALAQEQLAVIAQVDPEAKAAAERLGLELPVDVLSNDARLLTATGLARSQKNSDAEAAWGEAVSQTIARSDETLREIGATPDLAQISADVRDRLTKDMEALETQGAALRREVDDAINVRDRVDATNLQAALAETIADLGGIDEAKKAFSAEEKKLLAMLGEGEEANRPTYARLNQIRDQIGRALYKNQGPWVDAPTATLKKYYGALAQDQLGYVETVGGQELADKMRGSNDLFHQMFKAREGMQAVFGQGLERDIGPLINRAITGGRKGDGQAMRQLLEQVPEDMRGRVVLSGIFSQSQRDSAGGGFSFDRYAKTYRGLRENGPIYAQVAKSIGPEGERILTDLYSISKRMAAAEAKIVRTGASNQPLINALNAQGLIGRTVDASKRIGSRVAGAAVGGSMGGPGGAAMGYEVGSAIEAALQSSGKSRLEKLHGVLSSEPFKELVEKVGTGEAKQADVNRAANTPQFRTFARMLGISTFEGRKNWLQGAMTAGAVTQARPDEQPTSVIELR